MSESKITVEWTVQVEETYRKTIENESVEDRAVEKIERA